jgi:hypothetical protein
VNGSDVVLQRRDARENLKYIFFFQLEFGCE